MISVRHPLARPHSPIVCGGESRTEQSHAIQCDINRLIRTFERTGSLPIDPRGRVPNYGDVTHLNKPFDQLLVDARNANEQLQRFTREQKEKIRLARLEKHRQMASKAAAYDAHLAAVGKNSTTESQST